MIFYLIIRVYLILLINIDIKMIECIHLLINIKIIYQKLMNKHKNISNKYLLNKILMILTEFEHFLKLFIFIVDMNVINYINI